jgi:endo-1,4-beta-xylanase
LKKRIVVVALIYILLFGLTAGAASAEDSVKFYGYVTEDSGIPIKDSCVTVTYHDQNGSFFRNTQTDGRGYYELNVPRLPYYDFYVEGRECGDAFSFRYFPISKRVFATEPSTMQVDFKLRPAANIVIHAYDNSGNLLRNKDFKDVTSNMFFITDLNDIPNLAVYSPTHDSYSISQGSKGDTDLAIPAFITIPETLYKIHILWEVPGFGKVMLPADNQGQGYSVDEPGGQLTLNFNYEAAMSRVAMLQSDYDLLRSQGYVISNSVVEGLNSGKEHLRAAEEALLQAPTPDMKNAVAELNLSLSQSLWAHEQLYLDRAGADIEKYRQGSVKIKVVDEEGIPLNNVDISFEQTSRDFLFAVAASPYDNESEYIDLLKQAGINCIYAYFQYGDVEPEPGVFDFRSKDQQVNSLQGNGFQLIGDLGWLFARTGWGIPDKDCPGYLDSMSFDEIKENVYQHMYNIAERYRGKINIWEALAEPTMGFVNEFNWTWNQKFDIYITAARAIKDANSEAKIFSWNPSLPYELFIDYNPEDLNLDQKAGQIPYSEFIRFAMEKQLQIDIIGLHLVNSGVDVYVDPPHVHPTLDLVSISTLIDQYAKFDRPLFFREHQAPSVQVEGGSWWHQPWDETTQAEYVKQFYTLVFAKPLVTGIGWSTGFSDEETQKYGSLGGGLLDEELNPKPAYFALKDLVNSWTTAGTGITDENGGFDFRGFAGDYEITLKTSDGRSFKTDLHIYEQQTKEITIKILPVTSEVSKPLLSSEPEANPSPGVATVLEEVPSSTGNNLLLIAGVMGGILVVGLLTLFIIKRRAHKIE